MTAHEGIGIPCLAGCTRDRPVLALDLAGLAGLIHPWPTSKLRALLFIYAAKLL
jgi:hypothetical protein